MNPVIDVDSHWTFPWEFRLREGPLRRFAPLLPDEGDQLAFFLAGDMMETLPPEERPTSHQLFPMRHQPGLGETHLQERFEVNRTRSDAGARIAWMDRIGIDYALVNSGGFPAAYPLIEDMGERKAFLRASNDLLAEALEGHADRLGAVTYVDLTDLDWALAELTRMRRLGSRAFSIRAEPVGGKSLGHPHFDRLWSAITDLGMVVSVHTGLAPALFGDWGRLGIDASSAHGRGRFMRMANTQRHQAVELMLAALLFGGVLERHPKLSILIAELYVFWLPGLVARFDAMGTSNEVFGDWVGDMSPGALLNRALRVSPLIGLGDVEALDVLEIHPDMVVFSSDYPHSEGNADPIALYGPRLAQLAPDLCSRFMGSTMVESFARMGDPLPCKV